MNGLFHIFPRGILSNWALVTLILIVLNLDHKHLQWSVWYFFYVKLTFEMSTGRGHTAFIFENTSGCSCESFWDRKCLDLRGTQTPNLWIHAQCSNLLRYQGQHLLSHFFNTGPGGIDIFKSKANIWNVNCARATAFIFDTRTGVLVKVVNLIDIWSALFGLKWLV